MVFGVILTIVVWVNFGPIWGIVVGFFFVGGLG
jgi:hypothetical protein